jgi:polyisoprenoid-binding protein YceI
MFKAVSRMLYPRHLLIVFVPLLALASLAQGQPKSAAIDVNQSVITIHVFKSGLFSFAGDNHEVRAPIAAGTVDEGAKSVVLNVDANKLTVLDPALPPEKRAQVQKEMLSQNVLDVAHYPEIRFHSTQVVQVKPNEWNVRGDLTLHGQTRAVTVHVSRATGHYRGTAALKQTDFGMTPVSVAGGTIKVKDELKIDFDVVLH